MTQTIRATLVALVAAGALQSAGCVSTQGDCGPEGCGPNGQGGRSGGGLIGGDATLQERYNSRVDPCWPDRYNYQARQATLTAFANQAANGQAIDQTMFNGDFESGSGKLTPGGLRKLDVISRRRPVDGRIFVQTSRDVVYDPAKRDEFAKAKSDLDAARADAVQGYLAASTAGRRLNFEVAISDPQDMTVPVIGPANSIRGYAAQHVSGITGIAGTGFSGAGGQNFTSGVTGGNSGSFNAPGGPNAGNNPGTGGTGSGTPGGTGGR